MRQRADDIVVGVVDVWKIVALLIASDVVWKCSVDWLNQIVAGRVWCTALLG